MTAPTMRIASFLPAATEMVFALGLGDLVVGVSHECDYPPEAKTKPILVDCAIDMSEMTLAEIDTAVSSKYMPSVMMRQHHQHPLYYQFIIRMCHDQT